MVVVFVIVSGLVLGDVGLVSCALCFVSFGPRHHL